MAASLFHGKKSRDLPPDDDEINITAMIDIVLLLLIFFMITSNMESSTPLKVPAARHGEAVSVDQSIVVSIFKAGDHAEIYLTDGQMDSSQGPVDLAAVKAFVQQGVQADRKNFIIKADRDLPSGVVDDVARTASEVDPELKFFLGVAEPLK